MWTRNQGSEAGGLGKQTASDGGVLRTVEGGEGRGEAAEVAVRPAPSPRQEGAGEAGRPMTGSARRGARRRYSENRPQISAPELPVGALMRFGARHWCTRGPGTRTQKRNVSNEQEEAAPAAPPRRQAPGPAGTPPTCSPVPKHSRCTSQDTAICGRTAGKERSHLAPLCRVINSPSENRGLLGLCGAQSPHQEHKEARWTA